MIQFPEYDIQTCIYSSSSTRVYRAIRRGDRKPVIIRTLAEGGVSTSRYSRLAFTKELLNLFDHPNISKVVNWYDNPQTPLLVMEDIQGVNLHTYRERFEGQQLPLDIFLTIAIQIADALSVIHHEQVIHKDLHPGNIIISPETNHVQIIDFGLASLLSREKPSIDAPENIEGVLAYLSPEQTGRMNRMLDYRTDFYTLGITLYQLLTGRLPFQADDALGVIYAHMAMEPTPARSIRPGIPDVLSLIINKLLSKNAEDRYQSALGLKHDLLKCQESLRVWGNVRAFALGEEDISDHLEIPQKLYGRDHEIKTLMSEFQKAVVGQPGMLAISGYSGIGKTALVHEVYKPIAANNGVFVSGKFEQFQKNIPYSAIKIALKSWLHHVLTLTSEILEKFRIELLAELGANGRVLIDFMPEFELLLGKLDTVPVLAAQETQARFHMIFLKFIRFVTEKRPWVIFIDDLQWADHGTLSLLSELMGESRNRLLVIVAYRDNEVDVYHPVKQMLKNLDAFFGGKKAIELTLGPLPNTEIKSLLADTFHTHVNKVNALAELIDKKTAGNPFFIIEFLKTLYAKSLVNFDLASRAWQWNIQAIEAESITDNVVELMLARMNKLPEETQSLMQLASCIGIRFDLEILAQVAKRSISDVAQTLWPAFKEELLIQDGQKWRFQVGSERDTTPLKPLDVSLDHSREGETQCKFLHDRMLQAAYESLEARERKHLHLKVGRLLHQRINKRDLDQHVFEIVKHLNEAAGIILGQELKLQLAELNLRASKRAQEACVWNESTHYCQIGLSLLPDDMWSSHYELTLGLYKGFAESAYLSGQPELSSEMYDELLEFVATDIEKARIYSDRLVHTIGIGLWREGIHLGIQVLNLLGFHLPSEIEALNELQIEEVMPGYRRNFEKDVDSLNLLPELDDDTAIIIMKVLPNLSICGFVIGQLNLLKLFALIGLNVSIEKGKCDLLAVLLACYTMVLNKEENYLLADRVSKQALLIADNYPNCREAANTFNICASHSLHIMGPMQAAIDVHFKGYHVGMASGEIARASLNYCNIVFLMLSKGEVLTSLLDHSDNAMRLASTIRKSIFFPVPAITKRLVLGLTQKHRQGIDQLNDENLDPAYLAQIQNSVHLINLYHYRCQLFFWAGDFDDALYWALQVQQRISIFPRMSFYFDHLILLGLLLVYKFDDLTDEQAKDLAFCLDQLKLFSNLNPENFLHKLLLLNAELQKAKGEGIDVLMPLYERSIELASKGGFIHYEGLAKELLARTLYEFKSKHMSQCFLEEALQNYSDWGCAVKVESLQSMKVSDVSSSGGQRGAAFSYEKNQDITSDRGVTLTSEYHSASQLGLDYASVMKSSIAISSELELKGLVARVLKAIMENAGAQFGALILESEGEAFVEALIDQPHQFHDFLQHEPLSNTTKLPAPLINLTLRSGEIIKVEDASQDEEQLAEDYFLTKQPKSVLSMPVVYRDRHIGVLYMENNLIAAAFTEDRMDTINMLLSQAAISFENARMFKEITTLHNGLEEEIESRTKELQSARDQLVEAEKMVALGDIVSGVAVELEPPMKVSKTESVGISKQIHELSDRFKSGTLTKGHLTQYFENVSQSSEQIEEYLQKSSELVELFKNVSVENADDMLCSFVLSGQLLMLSQQLQPLLSKGSYELIIECSDDIVMKSYPEVINNIIVQLVENSVIHGFAGRDRGIIQISAVPGDHCIDIKVKDNGVGIAPSMQEKVFDPFVKASIGHDEHQGGLGQNIGAGLGCHIVYNLVTQKLGGNVNCNSTLGEGTCFTISIPQLA